MILPGAEPFFFPGGPVGFLLIHGFTATPQVMRGLGEYLAEGGATVLGIRLPGHGTRPEDLNRVRWQDWSLAVEEGWHLLQGVCRRVFIVGHSTGGALGLVLASQVPAAGAVAVSTLLDLPADSRFETLRKLPYPVRLAIFRVFARFKPFLQKGPPHWFDAQAQETYITYPVNPVHAILELRLFLDHFKARLPDVRCPVLLIHSCEDKFIDISQAEKIFAQVGSAEKNLEVLDNCGHVLPMDAERETFYRLVAEFATGLAERQRDPL